MGNTILSRKKAHERVVFSYCIGKTLLLYAHTPLEALQFSVSGEVEDLTRNTRSREQQTTIALPYFAGVELVGVGKGIQIMRPIRLFGAGAMLDSR
jgi:hypothetical protein